MDPGCFRKAFSSAPVVVCHLVAVPGDTGTFKVSKDTSNFNAVLCRADEDRVNDSSCCSSTSSFVPTGAFCSTMTGVVTI